MEDTVRIDGNAPGTASAAAEALPARIGRFEIRGELGRGAMGVVYDGWDPVIERRVAIKTLRHTLFDRSEAEGILSRFRREAQAAGRLSHPNAVAVHDCGEADGVAFIAMEFIAGRSLKVCLDAGERFAMPEVVRMMTQLLDALDYSHQRGVVHRDIKPANVMVLGDGSVKVTDFGVARIESSDLTRTGAVVGTPLYMSPEQFMGTTLDGRSDIFSAGVVLYQLLTGEKPFEGAAVTTVMHKVLYETPPPPSRLNVQVPAPFDLVVAKSMAKRPDDRYASAREFAEALNAAMSLPDNAEATAVAAEKPSAPPARSLPSGSSRPRFPIRSAALAGAVVIGMLASVWMWVSKGTPAPVSVTAPASQNPLAAPASRHPVARAAPVGAGGAKLPSKKPPDGSDAAATRPAPPPGAAPGRGSGREPLQTAAPGWQSQLRAEIDDCGRLGFARRQFCIERARWKFCNPDRWNAVAECRVGAE